MSNFNYNPDILSTNLVNYYIGLRNLKCNAVLSDWEIVRSREFTGKMAVIVSSHPLARLFRRN